jgi:lysyl-tRNA synthetase class 2
MSELEAQIANRKSKRDELESLGVEPYPARVEYDLEPSKVHQRFGERSAEELEAGENQIRVPGRLRAIRKHGKTSFLDLHDGNAKLQVMVRHQKLSESGTQVFDKLDVGDYVLADGFLLRTRTGELTLLANDISLLAKAVRPLPEKWHGLPQDR